MSMRFCSCSPAFRCPQLPIFCVAGNGARSTPKQGYPAWVPPDARLPRMGAKSMPLAMAGDGKPVLPAAVHFGLSRDVAKHISGDPMSATTNQTDICMGEPVIGWQPPPWPPREPMQGSYCRVE